MAGKPAFYPFDPAPLPCSYGPVLGGAPDLRLPPERNPHSKKEKQSRLGQRDEKTKKKACGHGRARKKNKKTQTGGRRSRSGDMALAELGAARRSGLAEDGRCPALMVPPRPSTGQRKKDPSGGRINGLPAHDPSRRRVSSSRPSPPSGRRRALGLLKTSSAPKDSGRRGGSRSAQRGTVDAPQALRSSPGRGREPARSNW